MKHKILVVGSGAREHAIIRALNRSVHKKEIYCIASNMNPGIVNSCENFTMGDINDPTFVTNYARQVSATIAIIGPENPLAAGVADVLWSIGIKTVGPTRDLAQIESSKAFTRNLLKEYHIPGGPEYKTFSSMRGVEAFLNTLEDNYVVKYDGLMGGKGVKVAGEHLHSHTEALAYCKELLDSDAQFVIEEKFIGEEFSLMSFCDGDNLKHMPAVQDHKRAYEGDTGPNTGGMGTYSDSNHSLPFLTKQDIDDAKKINQATAKAIKNKFDLSYRGILYGGFMATANGVKLIEYNARFGDPEAMNVLSILESDFVDICYAIVNGNLNDVPVKFSTKATVCKYAVPNGYPDNPVKGQEIDVSKISNHNGLYYASVNIQKEKLVESGSRTIAYVGIADSIFDAETIAENEIISIEGPLFHRKDIGKKELIQKRIDHMKSLR